RAGHRGFASARTRGGVGVVVELPDAAELSPEPHVERAPAGGNAGNRLAGVQPEVLAENIALTLYSSHVKPISGRPRSGTPVEDDGAAAQCGTGRGTGHGGFAWGEVRS